MDNLNTSSYQDMSKESSTMINDRCTLVDVQSAREKLDQTDKDFSDVSPAIKLSQNRRSALPTLSPANSKTPVIQPMSRSLVKPVIRLWALRQVTSET
jgi:hypothetical protein